MNSLLEFRAALRDLIGRPDAARAQQLLPLLNEGIADDLINDSWCGIAWEIAAAGRNGAPPPQLADCWPDVEEIVLLLVEHYNDPHLGNIPIDGPDQIDCLRAILFRPTR